MNRDGLRQRLKKQREKFSKKELTELGNQIAEQLFQTAWYRNSQTIHCFAGSAEKGEISTGHLLAKILYDGKRLVMPRMTANPGEMEHFEVTDLTSLITNEWGIREPAGGASVVPGEIGLVLVPGLAVDRRGNRIGYGMGYYDRFLTSVHGLNVMLVPGVFVLDDIPAEIHDVPVDGIVTEKQVIKCTSGNNMNTIS